MSFRKFIEYGAATRRTLTIRTNNLLFISKCILKQMTCEEVEFAIIFIDEENLKVGLKFSKIKPESEHRNLSKEPSGVTLNITPVLRFFRIKTPGKKIILDFEKEEELLVFSVKNLIETKK